MRQNKYIYRFTLFITLILAAGEALLLAQPDNDFPCDAIQLDVMDICSFSDYSNIDASNSGIPDPGCGSYQGGDIWFSLIVPVSGSFEIQTDTEAEAQFPDNNGWMFRAAMALYSGKCDSLVLMDCYENNSIYHPRMAGAVVSGQIPGDTIWVRIWENSNNDNGLFNICATKNDQTQCPNVFEVSGGGSFCEGYAGVDVMLSGSEPGVLYTLVFMDSIRQDTILGNGDTLTWSYVSQEGTYRIVAENPVDTCSIWMNGSAVVNENDLPKLSFDAVSISCFGHDDGTISTTVTNGQDPYELDWSGPAEFSSSEMNLDNLGPGEYTLTVTDFDMCVKVGPLISITEPALLVATLETVTHLTSYEANDGAIDISVTGGTTPYTIIWKGTDDYISSDPDPTAMTVGTYNLMVTDDHLCQDSIQEIVVSVAKDAQDVFIPEGFSPNGDGYNDLFVILGIEAHPENELVVFNRQGVEVYHSIKYENDWNGRPEEGGVLGGTLPEGTYYYVFTFGESSVRKGYVYIMKE